MDQTDIFKRRLQYLEERALRRAYFAGLALVLGTQALSALVMLFGNHAIVAMYTGDAVVGALAASLLLYAALFQFPDGVQVLSAGALRGLNDTRVPMWLAALAYWGIGMPVGAGLGLALGWGPKGMWLGLTAGLSVAAFLLCRRFLRSSRSVPIVQAAPVEAGPSVTVTDAA